jgi:plasmid stability protein
MAQLLVRNVSDDAIAILKMRAARNHRSVEAEHRALLEETLATEHRGRVEAWLRKTDALRQSLSGRAFTPSEILIRESRDER